MRNRDLNASPSKKLAEIVKGLHSTGVQGATGAHGVKHLGMTGDSRWYRPDGTEHSVRDIDDELQDARVRIEDAEQALVLTDERLEAAEGKVDGVREDLDNLDLSGAGSSSIVKDRAPLLEDGEALPAGAAWLHYGADGALVGMYRWTGEAWESLPFDRELIPSVSIGTGTFGDLEGERLVVNDTLSARIVEAMSAEVKELVVTEQAILNHATLIGQTVVDDINVQGKLIGTDGVFTGTVDFENVNVTGLQLVEKLEANSISADLIEGGAFTGESFTGGTFVGGEFRTSDDLPGQVRLSDTAADGGPGLQVTPSGAGSYETLPWIGPRNGGISVDGGEDGAGNRSFTFVSPRTVNLQANRDGKEAGSVYISENLVSLSRRAALGERGEVAAFPGFVRVRYEHDGVERGLAIDQSGVWVHTNRDGAQKYYNLEETAQDSGWINQPYPSGMSRPHGALFARRDMGKRTWWRGRFKKSSGKFEAGVATVLFTLKASDRPEYTTGLLTPSQGTSITRIEVSAGTGKVTARPGADTTWVSIDGLFIDQ